MCVPHLKATAPAREDVELLLRLYETIAEPFKVPHRTNLPSSISHSSNVKDISLKTDLHDMLRIFHWWVAAKYKYFVNVLQ